MERTSFCPSEVRMIETRLPARTATYRPYGEGITGNVTYALSQRRKGNRQVLSRYVDMYVDSSPLLMSFW